MTSDPIDMTKLLQPFCGSTTGRANGRDNMKDLNWWSSPNCLWRKSKGPKTIPQGLKPIVSYQAFAARLKPCPFKTRLSPQAAKLDSDPSSLNNYVSAPKNSRFDSTSDQYTEAQGLLYPVSLRRIRPGPQHFKRVPGAHHHCGNIFQH